MKRVLSTARYIILRLGRKTSCKGSGVWLIGTGNRHLPSVYCQMTSDKPDGRQRRSKMRTLCSENGDLVSYCFYISWFILLTAMSEYAASFFLLADHLRDAVQVCLNQLNDVQLAIAIMRAYEGDDGPVLREILEERVLPEAAADGNRWMASWAFWMLKRRDAAVRSLVVGHPSSCAVLYFQLEKANILYSPPLNPLFLHN